MPTIQQKLPHFFRAIDAAQASIQDPFTAEDRFLACNKPVRKDGEAHWAVAGFDYSLNRASEHAIAKNGNARTTWEFASAMQVLAVGYSLGAVCAIGAIAHAIHRARYQATGPYARRTDNGVREDKIARQYATFHKEVSALACQVSCLYGAKTTRPELDACYDAAAATRASLHDFVHMHPHVRIRGSYVLRNLLADTGKSMKRLHRNIERYENFPARACKHGRHGRIRRRRHRSRSSSVSSRCSSSSASASNS